MNFTWCCGSTKYIEAIKENSEVDLKSHQIFSYGELLEDLSLGDMSTTSLRYQYYRIKHKVNIPAHLSMFTDKIQDLDEGIGLQTFRVLHCDLKAVGCSCEDGVIFEGDCFQDVGEIASIVQIRH